VLRGFCERDQHDLPVSSVLPVGRAWRAALENPDRERAFAALGWYLETPEKIGFVTRLGLVTVASLLMLGSGNRAFAQHSGGFHGGGFHGGGFRGFHGGGFGGYHGGFGGYHGGFGGYHGGFGGYHGFYGYRGSYGRGWGPGWGLGLGLYLSVLP
jgi:hypothetical protein